MFSVDEFTTLEFDAAAAHSTLLAQTHQPQRAIVLPDPDSPTMRRSRGAQANDTLGGAGSASRHATSSPFLSSWSVIASPPILADEVERHDRGDDHARGTTSPPQRLDGVRSSPTMTPLRRGRLDPPLRNSFLRRSDGVSVTTSPRDRSPTALGRRPERDAPRVFPLAVRVTYSSSRSI